jgi:hypothetical protein
MQIRNKQNKILFNWILIEFFTSEIFDLIRNINKTMIISPKVLKYRVRIAPKSIKFEESYDFVIFVIPFNRIGHFFTRSR